MDKVKENVLNKLVEVGLLDLELGKELLGQLTDEYIKKQTEEVVYGQFDANKLAFYVIFKELMPEAVSKLEGYMGVAESAGWWWQLEDVAIMTERPVELHLDTEEQLHSAVGPALMYRDGWGIWSWHGTKIPKEWIEDSDNLDPQIALNHENVEMRRIAAEIIGWDKIIDALNPKVVNEDPDPLVGTLLEVDLPDAPGSQFLKVKCGTGRTFVLPCITNDFKTALEANAASWGDTGISTDMVKNLQVRT